MIYAPRRPLMTSDEIKQRGIEYLLSRRGKDKQPYELGARELSPVIGISESSVYSYMEKLVQAGEWETRTAYDPDTHKTIRVWWIKQ